MSVQKAIFPGLIIGIVCLIIFTGRLATAHRGVPVSTANKAEKQVSEKAAQTGECSVSAQYPESVRQWCGTVERYARENGLDPNLISAVMLQESAGLPDAYSKSGAVGLLQVMPRDGMAAGFMCPNGPCFSNRPSMQELFDPEYNISYGTRMLADLVQHYGDIREALKAYGPKDVGYYYADLVLGTFNNHK
jgi:soluble lytic murein transglycosylase-like protein